MLIQVYSLNNGNQKTQPESKRDNQRARSEVGIKLHYMAATKCFMSIIYWYLHHAFQMIKELVK